MHPKSTKLGLALILINSFLIAGTGVLPARAGEPASCPATKCCNASQLGEKATVFRFKHLRSGAVKTEKGWKVQDFASGFFNPHSTQITITMTAISDDPTFAFANGKVGTYTKSIVLKPMFGITDNVYIGSKAFGTPDWPVAQGTYFTGSVEFSSSEPFYYYMLPETNIGEDEDITKAYFKGWTPMVEPVPVVWDHDLNQFVVCYTNYWHNATSWPVGWHSDITINNVSDQPVTYTLRHIPFYGAQYDPKTKQTAHYKEQVIKLTLQPYASVSTTMQELFGWATDQLSDMEGALLISLDHSEARTGTAIYFSVVPNESGVPMHDVIL
jgi:hypothetical protein